MSPRTVGINLLWLRPGAVGGSEESTVASLLALRDLAPSDLQVRVYASTEFGQAHPEAVKAWPSDLLRVPPGRAGRLVAESTWLAARTRGLDLVHHAGGTVPPLRTAPCVLTLHDLQPLERRATHGRLKRAYLGRAIPAAAAGRSSRRGAERVRPGVGPRSL